MELSQLITDSHLENYSRVRSFEDIWRTQYRVPSIKSIVQYQGRDHAVLSVAKILTRFNKLFAEKSRLDPAHIAYCSEEIVELYGIFNLAEVALVCKKALRGEYGQTFGELDVMKVLTWFGNYDQERALEVDRRRREHEPTVKELESTETGRKILKRLNERFPVQRVKPVRRNFVDFVSWPQYCSVKGIDFDSFRIKFLAALEKRFDKITPDVDRDLWIGIESQRLLNKVNSSK